MLRKTLLALAGAFALPCAAHATTPIVVDGVLDASGYTNTSSVGLDPVAPIGNFDAPQSTARASYNVYLAAQNGYVYGFLQYTGGDLVSPTFANLYFDTDPDNPLDSGSDIGFELAAAHTNFFIPGVGSTGPVSGIQVAVSADGKGLEFAIPNSFFTTKVPGFEANYYSDTQLATVGSNVALRLSQSFNYSVAGGGSYGKYRLGKVTLTSAVPEPATWGMMISGFGVAGAAMRRRKSKALAAA
jgi:hypothetical protein